MPSGDNLSVVLFFIALAAAFYIQTLKPEIRRVRIGMWIAAVVLLLIGSAWPFLVGLSPAFAMSEFATTMTSLASNAWAWFELLMVALLTTSVLPVVERWQINRVSNQIIGTEVVSLPLSSRDEANREKIVVLSREEARLVYVTAQQVTNGLLYRMQDRDDPKDQVIAILANNHAFVFCNHAAAALSKAADDPGSSIDVLKQRLREFYEAYQRLVQWVHSLAALFSYPVKEDVNYSLWEERHKLFYRALRSLTASDDFSQLRKRLHGLDNDFLR